MQLSNHVAIRGGYWCWLAEQSPVRQKPAQIASTTGALWAIVAWVAWDQGKRQNTWSNRKNIGERNEPSGVFRFKEKIEGSANDLGRLRIRLIYIQRRGTKYPPPPTQRTFFWEHVSLRSPVLQLDLALEVEFRRGELIRERRLFKTGDANPRFPLLRLPLVRSNDNVPLPHPDSV